MSAKDHIGEGRGEREGLILGQDGQYRCFWVGHDPLYQRYHDEEWGLPAQSDYLIFESLCLEGFQAGLSWITILRKREAFRKAFAGFDFHRLATLPVEDTVQCLLQNKEIVRHRGKIEAVFRNARASISLIDIFGSFKAYLLPFAVPQPLVRKAIHQVIPSQTPFSIRLSKDLKKRGFCFVGPKTVYAFMQAQGMVNDHVPGCFCASRSGSSGNLR